MKSITKSKFSNETIEMLVSHNFENIKEISEIYELSGGLFNSAYSVSVQFFDGSEKELVLKASPFSDTKVTTIEKAIMKTEVFMLNLLPSKGVPMPAVVCHDFSREYIDCDYFFMEKLSGKAWNKISKKLTKQDKLRLKADLGRYLACIHETKSEYFGDLKVKSSLQFKTWREAFCVMIDNITNDAKRDNINFPYKKIRAALAPHLHLLDEITTPTLVYSDLWAGNIFLTDKSGQYKIEGFIDPERGFFGDPFTDFCSAPGIFSDIKKETELQKAYSEVRGKPFTVTRNDEIRMCMYNLHGAMFLGVETYRYPKLYGFFQLIYSKFHVRKYIKKLNSFLK